MLKKSAYAAPAIMTVGSVPRFAEGAPSCPDASENGKGVGEGCGGPSDEPPRGGPSQKPKQTKGRAGTQHTDNQYTDDQYVDGEYADEKYGN
jgi:hypothetical protein